MTSIFNLKDVLNFERIKTPVIIKYKFNNKGKRNVLSAYIMLLIRIYYKCNFKFILLIKRSNK